MTPTTEERERTSNRNSTAELVSQLSLDDRVRSLLALEKNLLKEGGVDGLVDRYGVGRKELCEVLGTAHLIYRDLDKALDYYIEAEDERGLRSVLEIGSLQGRYDALKRMNEGSASVGAFGGVDDYRFRRFVENDLLQNIQLERDADRFFLREDILESAFGKAGMSSESSEEAILRAARKMHDQGSFDTPRKLLLSLYSQDRELISRAKEEFEARRGVRKDADRIAKRIIEENGMRLVRKMQSGDSDDYYPLSANIYLAQKQGSLVVLKENIRYRIDYSTIPGCNIEKELYESGALAGFAPKYLGTLRSQGRKGLELMMLEHIEGEELSRYASKQGPLRKEEAIGIALQAASALKSMHDSGIIYGDMKDKNIIRQPDGRIRIVDFGMSSDRLRSDEDGKRFAYTAISNAEYACPEVIRRSRMYDKSDVFQLGIMTYKLLTGEHPFASGTSTQGYQEKESDLLGFSLKNAYNRADMDRAVFADDRMLEKTVSSMLEKEYESRPSVDETIKALERVKGDVV